MVFLFEYATCTREALPESIAVEGLAMFRALYEGFAKVEKVASFTGRTMPYFPELACAESWEESFEAMLEREEHALIIAPESDNLLLSLTRKLENAGVKNLGSASRGVAIAGDKYACYCALRGVNQPRAELFRGTTTLDFPLVAKPRLGAGCEGLRIITSEEELASLPQGYLLQEYVEGRPMSASLIVGDEIKLLSVNTQEFNGNSYIGAELPLSLDTGMEEIIKAVESIQGLAGYVGVDFVLGEELWVIEVNPRITTPAAALDEALGINLGELLLKNYYREALPEIKRRRRVKLEKIYGFAKNAFASIGEVSMMIRVIG
ncbi:ATP-grasp domain-containing protein [Candidatus Pyrohabitans sp.]